MSRRRSTKKLWLSSTLIVLLLVFLVTASMGIWVYGFQRVLDESIFYLIGASFTGVIIYLVGLVWNRKKWSIR